MRKDKYIILLILFMGINLYSQNNIYTYKNIPIKIVYNYYKNNVLDINDTNLKIKIDEKTEYYKFEIRYKKTELKYKIKKTYLDCSDSIVVILDSCNKKSDKVFFISHEFVRVGQFKFLQLPINKSYMFAPNHQVYFYFNKEPEFEKSNWIEMLYLKFYDKYLYNCQDNHNCKYAKKRFGDSGRGRNIRYMIQDMW